METLYAAHGINPIAYTTTAKAFFLNCAHVLTMPPPKAKLINIESTFHTFINVNYLEYVSVKGHYYLYLTVHWVGGARPLRLYVFDHPTTIISTVPPFRSSSGNN